MAEKRGTAVPQTVPPPGHSPAYCWLHLAGVGLNTHHAPLSTKALGKKQARIGLGALSQEHQDHPETLSPKAPSPRPHFPWADTAVSYSRNKEVGVGAWPGRYRQGSTGAKPCSTPVLTLPSVSRLSAVRTELMQSPCPHPISPLLGKGEASRKDILCLSDVRKSPVRSTFR